MDFIHYTEIQIAALLSSYFLGVIQKSNVSYGDLETPPLRWQKIFYKSFYAKHYAFLLRHRRHYKLVNKTLSSDIAVESESVKYNHTIRWRHG